VANTNGKVRLDLFIEEGGDEKPLAAGFESKCTLLLGNPRHK
jgi:hypothetical protein